MKPSKSTKLLTYLVSEADHWTSASLLSNYLSVSTRQIRKYIAAINQDAGAALILSGNQGYRVDMNVYTGYRERLEQQETPAMRINYIIQKLVSEKDGYDLYDLSEELYVSDATIENDLREVRQMLKKYQLTLRREKERILLEGEEKEKRNLMRNLISSDSYDNFVLKDEVRFLTFHYHFWDFRSAISEIFARNDIFVNDYTLNNTALHLIIMIDRIRNHCTLQNENGSEKLKGTRQHTVAQQIRTYIEETYHLQVNKAELYNLTLVISNNTSMIDYSFITPDNISEYIEQTYIDITRKVLKSVENVYCLDAFDEEFITKFTIHIKNLFSRADNNYFVKNPLTSKIKLSFPLIYDIAVFIAQEFKNDHRITLTEDEITFIALHIGSYFENKAQNKSRVIVAFVYADYYSGHKPMLDRIRQRFDNQISIRYAISINNFQKTFPDVDLILSTIDMPFSQEHVILQPFLTERDLRNIGEHVSQITRRKENQTLKSSLINFLDEQLFYKNPQFDSKEQAIHVMCEDLIHLGYAQEGFEEAVLARERMSSTAFHAVAVPHALSRCVNTSFICVAISEEALHWGNHPVHMVAMIGISDDSRKLFSEVFDALIDILSEPGNIHRLSHAVSFQDFFQHLQRMMDEVRLKADD